MFFARVVFARFGWSAEVTPPPSPFFDTLLTRSQATLDEERSEIITRRAKLELSVKDAQEALDRETTGRGGREAELASLEEEITAKNAELDALKPDFEVCWECLGCVGRVRCPTSVS